MARQKYNVKQYENKDISAGVKIKKVTFKSVKDMCNWYMTEVPSIQEQESY